MSDDPIRFCPPHSPFREVIAMVPIDASPPTFLAVDPARGNDYAVRAEMGRQPDGSLKVERIVEVKRGKKRRTIRQTS